MSIADDGLAWARKPVPYLLSLSAVVSEAIRRARQAEARKRVLLAFGDAAKASPDELAAIYREWQQD